LQISLAPAPSNWGKEKIKQFYKEVALMPVDNVYIGETVCSKRDVFSLKDIEEITGILKQNNKKVIFSTLGLLTTLEEFDIAKGLLSIADGVEVNSLGILNLLLEKPRNQEIVIGSFLNTYNRDTAEVFLSFGSTRIVLPSEISFSSIADIATKTKALEVTVWGSLTCSISWRCYTARSFGLERKNCAMKCMNHPQGMLLKNVDDKDLFIIDGPQVLSAMNYCLIEQIEELKSIGIQTIRIQPSINCSAQIVDLFKQAIDGKIPLNEAKVELEKYSPHGISNGWYYAKAGIDNVAGAPCKPKANSCKNSPNTLPY
jgi:collagenase-like PrtC family protease